MYTLKFGAHIKNCYSWRSMMIFTFIDDYTRMACVSLLKSKSDVSSVFQAFHMMVQTQYNANIQVLQSDNKRECIKERLRSYLTMHGIIYQTTCSYMPQ